MIVEEAKEVTLQFAFNSNLTCVLVGWCTLVSQTWMHTVVEVYTLCPIAATN